MSNKQNNDKLNKILNIVIISILCVLFVCIIIILIQNHILNKRKSVALIQFNEELSSELEKQDGILDFKIDGEVITLFVPSSWNHATDQEKKEFCESYQDAITVIRNHYPILADGYYAQVNYYDKRGVCVAHSNPDGSTDLK